MENLLMYFVKVSGLLIIFYLTYAILLQKETFFTANRWFLIGGLFTSLLLPFYFFEKVVLVATPKNTFQDVIVMGKNTVEATNHFTPENQINWSFILICSYLIVAAFLGFKIIAEIVSLFYILNKKEVIKEDKLAIVDLNKDIAPFSFFNYIVYNSRLYSDNELQNILSHERIHSREKHSFDILISKIFCVVFWFNPFVWLYKKALIQNLEYIADQKAIQNTNDKKAYQITLLKVVSNQNCFTITNSFYQSLIKKRIVMLNKTQSKKWNSWKYALIIPSLVTFVILFQVKVVAQERQNAVNQLESSQEIIEITIDKNTTDEEIKNNIEKLKNDANVECNISKIKRNLNGEITCIFIIALDSKGSRCKYDIDSDKPITPVKFNLKKDKNGTGDFTFCENNTITGNENDDIFSNDMETPVAPVPPSMATSYSKMPTPPTPPRFPAEPTVKAPKAPNFPTAPRAPKGSPEKGDENEKKMRILINKNEKERTEEIQVQNDEIQAKIDIEQARKDEIQARKDKIQARKDEIVVRKDKIHARKDEIQANLDKD